MTNKTLLRPWYAFPLILIGLALVLFLVPSDYEGSILLPISEGHALSVLDAIAVVPLVIGAHWILIGLVKRKKLIVTQVKNNPPYFISLFFIGGFGLGLLIASAFSSFFWWFLIGAIVYTLFNGVLIYITKPS